MRQFLSLGRQKGLFIPKAVILRAVYHVPLVIDLLSGARESSNVSFKQQRNSQLPLDSQRSY
jgi:hypothetical protein